VAGSCRSSGNVQDGEKAVMRIQVLLGIMMDDGDAYSMRTKTEEAISSQRLGRNSAV
jgi:hypothetical protein